MRGQFERILGLLDGGRPLPSSRGEWRLFRPGSRETPVGQARSGEALTVDAGIYDVQLLLRDGRTRGSRWITGSPYFFF